MEKLEKYIGRQREWSLSTFGPGARDEGISNHIRKELAEIAESPGDIMEWIDVIILALDGALRNGYSPADIIAALTLKQAINFERDWPDWREFKNGEPIEHVRGASDE